MKFIINLNTFRLIFLIALCVWCSSFETCNGREGVMIRSSYWRKLKAASGSSTFNVLDYGAKGDGKADDTKAFQQAWAAACNVKGSRVLVPSGSVFLVKIISFKGGTCQPNIFFQVDGKIIAPTSASAWGSGTLQWLEFKELNKFTIKGKGVIDGQGSVWWNRRSGFPTTKPTALRFYGSNGVTVTGITIQQSQQTHLKFDSCTNVQVSAITVSSPGDSPNTDGIHLQNSQDVVIYSSTLACGDDCVSIQTGCSNVYIHNVNCGPRHGISIGGLGKDNTRACVSNVTVRDTTFQNSLTAVRIKTWQGGSGSVHDIRFSDIQVSEVGTPIMIDQYYCDKRKCGNDSSAVAVSGIDYVNVKGTFFREAVRFACSDAVPCTGLTLDTVQLQPQSSKQGSSFDNNGAFCWKAFGELKTKTVPALDDCLQSGNPSSRINSNQDSC
ncbi:polygalacturonase At1g48100-like [Prosopis cineraria]|uniref:polygalacturonase At1g48100-like n=1 Tax=Prosopis cineraria TaxID=364024 RepID=UPI0024104F08|nr:polygalacturonase At1g48100-like [Prosopis cineraria]